MRQSEGPLGGQGYEVILLIAELPEMMLDELLDFQRITYPCTTEGDHCKCGRTNGPVAVKVILTHEMRTLLCLRKLSTATDMAECDAFLLGAVEEEDALRRS